MQAFPLDLAWLIKLTFCSELRPGDCSSDLADTDISLQLTDECAAAAKNARSMLGVRRDIENKAEGNVLLLYKNLVCSSGYHISKGIWWGSKRHRDKQLKLSRE